MEEGDCMRYDDFYMKSDIEPSRIWASLDQPVGSYHTADPLKLAMDDEVS